MVLNEPSIRLIRHEKFHQMKRSHNGTTEKATFLSISIFCCFDYFVYRQDILNFWFKNSLLQGRYK